jgi:predicted nucleotidyltransferase
MQLADLEHLFLALKPVFEKFKVEYFLLGSFVRDYWMLQHNIQPIRSTNDVDIAIMIGKCEDYDRLINELLDNKLFEVTTNRFCILFKKVIYIDIIPFGKMKIMSNGTIQRNLDHYQQ